VHVAAIRERTAAEMPEVDAFIGWIKSQLGMIENILENAQRSTQLNAQQREQ
jgi:hypothetical protein